VVQETDEDLDGSLDVRKEGLSGGGEDVSNGVGSDLLLDGDTRVDSSEKLLELVRVVLDVEELGIVLLVDGGVSVRLSVGSAESIDGGLNSGVDVSILCKVERRTKEKRRDEKSENWQERNEKEAEVEVATGRVEKRLTGQVLVGLVLLTRGDQSLHNVGKVDRELVLENLGHGGEEDEGALPQPRVVEDETLEGELDERLEVRPEDVLSDGLGDGSEGVGGDSSKVGLLSLVLESQEGLHSSDGGLEVGDESVLGSVSGRSDGSGDGGSNGDGSVLEENEESLHQEREVVGDRVAEDLEVGIESGASGLLSEGIGDVVEEDL